MAQQEKNKTVLLFEDDEDEYEHINSLLQRCEGELELRWVANSAQALSAISAGCRPDVCLVDYQSGLRDGLDLLRKWRDENGDVAVILLTNADDRAVDTEALQIGASDYLIKGHFNAEDLERSIRYSIAQSETLRSLQEVALQNARLAAAIDSLDAGIFLTDAQTETNPISFHNSGFLKLTGLRSEQVIGRNFCRLPGIGEVLGAEAGEVARINDCFKRQETYTGTLLLSASKKRWWAHLLLQPMLDEHGRAIHYIGVLTDITERKETDEKLQRSAFYDTLTNLPNRALFTERVQIALNRARRHPDARFAVMVMDIDRFKNINDSLGHEYGDRLLIEVARRLQEGLRVEDTIARLGGDEFAILIEETGYESAVLRTAERVHAQFEKPFHLEGHDLFVSVSIGITRSATGYDNPDFMLRDADTAMYRAKWQGPGRHELFDQAMHERVRALLRVETDLRRAVDQLSAGKVEFLLHYQPIISLDTGRTEGFEALIRWQHPERGMISPFDFIPIAEETGLIVPIGAWVLREACRQASIWQQQFPRDPPLSINVNLSSRQFLQPDLIEQIKQVLEETGIAPQDLKLEITESVLMTNPEAAATMLLQLRDLGVKLSIDDFGTGYSSLAYLRRFPITGLKVDRSFVNNMDNNNGDLEIVRSIVGLAHNLRLRVTAEGVENGGQLSQLRELNCESSQGYFFSRPMTSAAATQLLQIAPNW